jgi:hypothetical protein
MKKENFKVNKSRLLIAWDEIRQLAERQNISGINDALEVYKKGQTVGGELHFGCSKDLWDIMNVLIPTLLGIPKIPYAINHISFGYRGDGPDVGEQFNIEGIPDVINQLEEKINDVLKPSDDISHRKKI